MDIIGRDDLIDTLWTSLDSDLGLVLSATRRIGKTSIIQKMEKQANNRGYVAIYHDLEAVESPEELAQVVRHRLASLLPKEEHIAKGADKVFDKYIRGLEFGKFKFNQKKVETTWKEDLKNCIDCLLKNQTKRCVLFWDEFPVMLSAVIRTQENGFEKAKQILDVLRELRQSNQEKLRMVFTGSVGIHLVLASLKRHGYTNNPINDMLTIEVEPLAEADAITVIGQLLIERDMHLDLQIIQELSYEVDCIPHFIKLLVNEMKIQNSDNPRDVLRKSLAQSSGDWNLDYFVTRIEEYYEESAELVLSIVDLVAYRERLSYGDITSHANMTKAVSENDVRKIVRSLAQDQYFRISEDAIEFRFNFLRTWWCLNRSKV